MDDDEGSVSEDEEELVEGDQRGAPTPLFGSDDGSAERAMDSLDQAPPDPEHVCAGAHPDSDPAKHSTHRV